MLNGWEHSGQMDVLHVRICAEFQAVEEHRDPAFGCSAKGQREKVRHNQAIVVDAKAASAGQSRHMKNRVCQMDFMARITARSSQLSVCEFCFAMNILGASRRFARPP